jgi:hypothetical protein
MFFLFLIKFLSENKKCFPLFWNDKEQQKIMNNIVSHTKTMLFFVVLEKKNTMKNDIVLHREYFF